jgi:HEAT repeat protein
MSKPIVERPIESLPPGENPLLANWLVAFSHDSPFDGPQVGAVRGAASVPLTTMQELLSQLNQSDREVRLRAATALGDFGAGVRRALPALRAALKEVALTDEDEGVRAEAVRAMLQAGPQPATEVGALVDSLHSDLDLVRFHAAVALEDLGPASRPAVPDLVHTSLWDDDPAVRVGAAMAIWKIDAERKGPVVIDVLMKALDDPNEMICWMAADSLGQIGVAAQQAIPALRRVLQREFKVSLIKTGVLLALERIEAQPTAGGG